MRIRKSEYIELDGTCCYTKKFNMVFSLYRVLEVTLYFSKGFLEVAIEGPVVRNEKCGLSFSYFLIYFILFSIYFCIFIFIEHRIRISHVTQEERCRRY